MPPRRSHKKSRAGCRRCKARKIKCDEVHPRCGNCVKHGVACDFEHPETLAELQASSSRSPSTPGSSAGLGSPMARPAASSFAPAPAPLCRPPPTPALSNTTPARHRLLELKLMHHYTALTCKTFTFTAPRTEDIWKITVPSLAFSGSQHLADAVLAVAALHLRNLTPNDKELVRASHAYMAASLAEYSATLTRGIDSTNAEALFLTASLIAFQATATRVFVKDEPNLGACAAGTYDEHTKERGHAAGCYAVPFSWFHSFQGVKAITAASWQYIRASPVVTKIINSQAVLQLDFTTGPETFFGHLLDGLDEELAAMSAESSPSQQQGQPDIEKGDVIAATRQAYHHAVAVLNWAHKIPHKGAPLAFPATVSRRYIELLEERQPRALAILACFFALLKSMDSIWWLQGMARREVLGVVSLFNSDFLGPDAYQDWWPHLEWAMRIALYEHKGAAIGEPIPAEIWGADWFAEERALDGMLGNHNYIQHIEMVSRFINPFNDMPPIPE